MAYRYPGEGTKAAVELYPIAGKKATAAASEAGLSASSIPTLLVEGDDKPGLGHAIAQAIAGAGVNMTFAASHAQAGPASATGAPSAAQVEDSQTFKITRSGSRPSRKGPAERFTGSVKIEPLFPVHDPSQVLGQILIVTAGVG